MIPVIPRANIPDESTSVVLICYIYMFLMVQICLYGWQKGKQRCFIPKKEMQMPERFQPDKKETGINFGGKGSPCYIILFLGPGQRNHCWYIHKKNSIILAPGTTWQMLPRRIHPIARSQQRQTSMLVPYRSA